MKLLNIKPMNNGRIRFELLGRDGFLAVRKRKARWGFQRGQAFNQLHLWRYSLAIESAKGTHKPLWHWVG